MYAEGVASNLTLGDWARLVGVQVALILGLGSWMLFLQSRTDNRLDRIAIKMDSQGERIAHIEGLLAGAKLRLDASSAGD